MSVLRVVVREGEGWACFIGLGTYETTAKTNYARYNY